MRRLWLWAGALALIAAAAAGCGGDDGDTTAAQTAVATEATVTLGKEELIAQGDAICAEVNAAVGTVGSTSSSGVSQAVQVADLYSGMVARLKDLGSPSDDAAGYPEFIAAAEELAQAESDVQLAAERGEEEALAAAEADASSALASFQSAANAYGFERCGEAPSAPVPGTSPAEAGATEETAEGVEEEAPEAAEEEAPEAGGAGAVEEGGEGGGAAAGGTEGGGETGGGGSSGGIGPG